MSYRRRRCLFSIPNRGAPICRNRFPHHALRAKACSLAERRPIVHSVQYLTTGFLLQVLAARELERLIPRRAWIIRFRDVSRLRRRTDRLCRPHQACDSSPLIPFVRYWGRSSWAGCLISDTRVSWAQAAFAAVEHSPHRPLLSRLHPKSHARNELLVC